jgi:hypothetical protein
LPTTSAISTLPPPTINMSKRAVQSDEPRQVLVAKPTHVLGEAKQNPDSGGARGWARASRSGRRVAARSCEKFTGLAAATAVLRSVYFPAATPKNPNIPIPVQVLYTFVSRKEIV